MNEEEKAIFVHILPTFLLSLVPDPNKLPKIQPPEQEIYLSATLSIRSLIKKLDGNNILVFLKILIDTNFIIINNAFDYSVLIDKKTQDNDPIVYTGELIPIIEECLHCCDLEFPPELEKAFQGFWISLVIQSGGDVFNVFQKWTDSLKYISCKTVPFLHFENLINITTDVQGRINKVYLKNEDILFLGGGNKTGKTIMCMCKEISRTQNRTGALTHARKLHDC